ncbi:MAG: hypothetical protein KME55_39160 [Nostoc indistinguendum CM1-VF10]|nr:hypothetical protein [Nostoc indistinguendum CM1-VF10]
MRSLLAGAWHGRTSKGDAYGGLRLRKKTTLMYYVKQVARPPGCYPENAVSAQESHAFKA